jgi:hypothetical protein
MRRVRVSFARRTMPAQVGFLHEVFGFGDGAEHPITKPERGADGVPRIADGIVRASCGTALRGCPPSDDYFAADTQRSHVRVAEDALHRRVMQRCTEYASVTRPFRQRSSTSARMSSTLRQHRVGETHTQHGVARHARDVARDDGAHDC